ncbi:MAG: tetratricopeptide repeat protein [Sedimentisphaerales bacterium]|nr:tetratricopeptide repeat protein [Sedimentisphaerales bacterium]
MSVVQPKSIRQKTTSDRFHRRWKSQPSRNEQLVPGAAKGHFTLNHIRDLLKEGRVKDALDLINRHQESSDDWQNARGVCLLRLGLYKEALEVLRPIVFPDNSICMPEGVPALYRVNFATAMLLMHYMDGAMLIIKHFDQNGHPYVKQLHEAVTKWRQSLTSLQKMGLILGFWPKKAIQMDFPLGDI